MNLFQLGDFTLRSGVKSTWKIECDALSPMDWAGLAAMAVEVLPPFSGVVGVPRGGVPFAEALERHCSIGAKTLLFAEDVVTTGGSIERYRRVIDDGQTDTGVIIGVCVFARGRCPGWITPLFQMPVK